MIKTQETLGYSENFFKFFITNGQNDRAGLLTCPVRHTHTHTLYNGFNTPLTFSHGVKIRIKTKQKKIKKKGHQTCRQWRSRMQTMYLVCM